MENKTDWEDEISLFDLINVLLKRKWLIVGITLLVVVVAFLAWKLVPQTYQAEFTVSFTESSFPKEFKGQVAITYYGEKEPVCIPYSFSLSSEDQELPGRTLDSFAKKQKLAELAREAGLEALFERAGNTLSVNVNPQKDEEFSVVLSAKDEELCRKTAETLAPEIRKELLSALQKVHNAKLSFYQELLKTAEENHRIARDKFFTFLEKNGSLTSDTKPYDKRIQEIQQSLKELLERRKTLLSQQDAPLLSFPLPPEALRELSFAPVEEMLDLQEEIKNRIDKKIAELERKISSLQEEMAVLEQEKRALEQEKLRQNELIDAYNLLLRDYVFWKEVKSSLLLSLPPLAEDGAYPFDGKVEVGEIKYSGSGRDLKLHLAVGLVAGLFLGVFVAFFAEFWEKAKMQRS